MCVLERKHPHFKISKLSETKSKANESIVCTEDDLKENDKIDACSIKQTNILSQYRWSE